MNGQNGQCISIYQTRVSHVQCPVSSIISTWCVHYIICEEEPQCLSIEIYFMFYDSGLKLSRVSSLYIFRLHIISLDIFIQSKHLQACTLYLYLNLYLCRDWKLPMSICNHHLLFSPLIRPTTRPDFSLSLLLLFPVSSSCPVIDIVTVIFIIIITFIVSCSCSCLWHYY